MHQLMHQLMQQLMHQHSGKCAMHLMVVIYIQEDTVSKQAETDGNVTVLLDGIAPMDVTNHINQTSVLSQQTHQQLQNQRRMHQQPIHQPIAHWYCANRLRQPIAVPKPSANGTARAQGAAGWYIHGMVPRFYVASASAGSSRRSVPIHTASWLYERTRTLLIYGDVVSLLRRVCTRAWATCLEQVSAPEPRSSAITT